MKTAAMIAAACAGGGLARYYLSLGVHSLLGRAFPYGTLAVNVLGAFFIGVVMELGLRPNTFSDPVRLTLTVGFMGGLTTFSTFSYETFKLIEQGRLGMAFTNVVASVGVCLLCTWLGVVSLRAIMPPTGPL